MRVDKLYHEEKKDIGGNYDNRNYETFTKIMSEPEFTALVLLAWNLDIPCGHRLRSISRIPYIRRV